ncbi:MAG: ParB/RepB/Spo0J family partition protein [Erysipelotrichaceae bacterium]
MSKLKTSVEPSSRRGVVEEAFINVWGEGNMYSIDRVTVSDWQLVDIPLALLKPYEANAFFTLDGIEAIAESILEVGLVNPIVVEKDVDGRYFIISGFNRVKAYELLNQRHPDGKFIKIPGYIVSRKDSDDPNYLDKVRAASNINLK